MIEEVLWTRGTADIDRGGRIRIVGPTNVTNPLLLAATVIDGYQQVVTFSGGEDANCLVTGLTTTGGKRGIHCPGSSPAVPTCHIPQNLGVGMELTGDTKPTIAPRIFAANCQAGIAAYAEHADRSVCYNPPCLSKWLMPQEALE